MSNLEEAIKIIQCPEYQKLKSFYPNLSLDKEISEKPELAEFLRASIQRQAMAEIDPLTLPDAPKFNDDFSNYFIINNLPKCKEDKIAKLVQLIESTIKKKNLKIEEGAVEIPINPETQETDGVAFVRMQNEEYARFGVAVFDGFRLTAKNVFAACLFPEYEKIMQTKEQFEMPQAAANYEDLRAPIFDIKSDQYFYKTGQNLNVNYFSAQQQIDSSHNLLNLQKASDKPISWSPNGTFLIVIKPDKVIFLGGKEISPIIVLPQQKVHCVKMSPCEKYVLTYSPLAEVGFTVWNFQMVEVIREFPIEQGEDDTTWKWSFDGKYIGKKFKKEIVQDQKTKVKEGVSIFELPSMELLKTQDGVAKSITIDGVEDWNWAPNKNLIIYTAYLQQELEIDETKTNIDPRIGFLKIPERRFYAMKNFKSSENLKMVFHPQGTYLAVINQYRTKKSKQYAVELFDLTSTQDIIPHQQIHVNREIYDFYGVYWEPNNTKLAIHTNSKREVELGKRDYTVDAKRMGVDIYDMHKDPQTGFEVKLTGYHPSEKILDFSWSPAGDVFAICEKDGLGSGAKLIWSFYMIVVNENQEVVKVAAKNQTLKEQKITKLMSNTNQMLTQEIKYEFRKTARHEVSDSKTEAQWDYFGRYLCVYGVKKPGPFDREKRSIRIFSLMGDLLFMIDKLPELSDFKFRPRPKQILSKKDLTTLKADFRKKYGKQYKEEERKDTTIHNDEVRAKKSTIVNEFLSTFFLPLRQKYESDIQWYVENWPIKQDQMEVEPATINHIYAYGEQTSIKKAD